MQVFDVSARSKDGSYTISLWDVNTTSESDATVKINVNRFGALKYNGSTELSGVIPLRWDTAEIGSMITQNLNFCNNRPGFCTQKH
jgi:hypothetical protein